MAPRGPRPKPAHLRQRTNQKAGHAQLEAPISGHKHDLPNPDDRVWHPLTLAAWDRAWESPMATQWLETDADALGRLALLWDDFYKKPGPGVISEIRLQEQRFGFSPLDRSRLQWEVNRADEAELKQKRQSEPQPRRTGTHDPRMVLQAVK